MDNVPLFTKIVCFFTKKKKKNMHHFLPISTLHTLLLIASLCECVFVCVHTSVCVVHLYMSSSSTREHTPHTYHNHHHHTHSTHTRMLARRVLSVARHFWQQGCPLCARCMPAHRMAQKNFFSLKGFSEAGTGDRRGSSLAWASQYDIKSAAALDT